MDTVSIDWAAPDAPAPCNLRWTSSLRARFHRTRPISSSQPACANYWSRPANPMTWSSSTRRQPRWYPMRYICSQYVDGLIVIVGLAEAGETNRPSSVRCFIASMRPCWASSPMATSVGARTPHTRRDTRTPRLHRTWSLRPTRELPSRLSAAVVSTTHARQPLNESAADTPLTAAQWAAGSVGSGCRLRASPLAPLSRLSNRHHGCSVRPVSARSGSSSLPHFPFSGVWRRARSTSSNPSSGRARCSRRCSGFGLS